MTTKERIKGAFNNIDNESGDKLRILLLTPSAKEGISLFSVKQIHIMEPHWNNSRILQVLGRGLRFCSHKNIKNPEDRIIQGYIYLSTHSSIMTVDSYINSIALKKEQIIKQFEKVLKESAVDCVLNSFANTELNPNNGKFVPVKCVA